MCIIIDTNVLGSVFNRLSDDYEKFKPVYNWIFDGKGRIVFGGTTYINEIGRKYLGIITELKKLHKAVSIDKTSVDVEEKNVSKQVVHKDFDDPHLVALLRISKCKLICSADQRAYPFFKHHLFFSPASTRPKIYSNKSNKKLLMDVNIAEVCKPCIPMSQILRKKLNNIL